MKARVILVGLADGRPSEIDGAYLVDCDVDARNGRGTVTGTRNPEKAKVFDSPGDAMAFWQRQSNITPTRPDGKPNRPLTAYTVSVEPVDGSAD